MQGHSVLDYPSVKDEVAGYNNPSIDSCYKNSYNLREEASLRYNQVKKEGAF